MKLQIHPLFATAMIAGILILIFALFRGCNQAKSDAKHIDILMGLTDSFRVNADRAIAGWELSNKKYQDSLEFVKGQYALIKNQELRTAAELQDVTKANKILIAKHKLAEYTDTSAVITPREFVQDCQGCFVNLEKTTNLIDRYKNDINNLQNNWDKQSQLYQKRFKELDAEKLGFYNKINTLAKAQQETFDKLKPHGRLYLSTGIIWGPWPKMIGGGILYQNKRNLLLGAKWYYGNQGQMVETSINFPLSLRRK